MTATLRNTLLSFRDLLATGGPFILIAIALLAIAYWLLDPMPPKRVVLATGPDQGAYAEFGKRYAQELEGYGITVELRTTQGAAENLRLLADPKSGVDIAFAQGGAGEKRKAEDPDDPLVSLGSLFYEPVWLFYRKDSAQRLLKAESLTSLKQLEGWRFNIGARGSGAPNLMLRMFEANALERSAVTLLRLEQTPAVMALLAGEIDALVFASAPESLMVQMLLKTPDIRLFSFSQSEAYARRFPFLSPVVLPRGLVDLAQDLPPEDVKLVAPTASLVTRASTHPALVQLFVQTAAKVHGGAGWFQHKGEFPSATNNERPLADEAERFYKDGGRPPLLQRYMPFWLANLLDRTWLVLLPLIAILIPLSRTVPPLYEFRVRSRIFRWYGQLRGVEDAIGTRPAAELLDELQGIEQRVEQVTVPLSYADELYALRTHIQMVGNRLRATSAQPQPSLP